MTESQWYYLRNKRPVGPVSMAQLKEVVASGNLTPADMVLRAGTQKWLAASQVKGLFPEPRAANLVPEPVRPVRVTAGLVVPKQVRSPATELYVALIAISLITVMYAYAARRGAPKPAGLLGHGLGIVGFVMMLSTETLYSLRKRLPRFTVGRMSTWLQVHIFTGFVGSYLVLLHSAGKFNGLAGILALLTVVMVLSGFVGRYIYTAVPRTLDGVEVAVRDLEDQIAGAERQLKELGLDLSAAASDTPRGGWLLVFGLLRWRQRRHWHQALQDLRSADRARAAELERLLAERYRLRMQIDSLAATRRLLALWHVFHVPLGIALFALAALHIGGALYYATLLK